MSIYGAAKGAINKLKTAAAAELADRNIRVNAVAPGMTRAPVFETWVKEQADPEQTERDVVADIPPQAPRRLAAPPTSLPQSVSSLRQKRPTSPAAASRSTAATPPANPPRHPRDPPRKDALMSARPTALGTVLDGPALWSAQAHIPSVLGRQIVIERGEGSYVHTTDGRRLFDGTAGLWNANIGHCHPALAEAARTQMLRLEVALILWVRQRRVDGHRLSLTTQVRSTPPGAGPHYAPEACPACPHSSRS